MILSLDQIRTQLFQSLLWKRSPDCRAARALFNLICTPRELVSGYFKISILLGTPRLEKGTSSSTHWQELDSIYVTGGCEAAQSRMGERSKEISRIWSPGSILRYVEALPEVAPSKSRSFAYGVLRTQDRMSQRTREFDRTGILRPARRSLTFD